MVQPNNKVYPFAYISEKIYEKWKKRIDDLAEQTRTTITYNFIEQFFDITGRSQEGVEKAVQHICQGLLPKLNENIDDNMMRGTFATLADMEEAATRKILDFTSDNPTSLESSNSIMNMSSQQQQQQQCQKQKVYVGRPLELEEYDDIKAAMNNIDVNGSKGEEEEEEEEEKEELDHKKYKAIFKFSRNVSNPQEVLKGGPPGPNLQAIDYLKDVMILTDTECYLEGQDIHISGDDQEQVEDALQRFLTIQTVYKRARRPVTIVPCIHYPTDSPYYGLYFCNLNRYAQKEYVDLLYHDSLRPMYVLLPVFKNPETGQFQKPRDLLEAAPRISPHQQAPPPQPSQPQHMQESQSQQPPQIAHPPRPSWVQHPRQPPIPNNYNSRSSSAANIRQPMSNNSTEIPLWGENRSFVNNYAGSSSTLSPSSSPTTPSPSSRIGYQQHHQQLLQEQQQEQQQPKEDFPLLPSASQRQRTYVPMKENNNGQKQQRRVIRLINQQYDPGYSEPRRSQLETAREYNLNNILTALTEGLESVRGFKGEVKLEAKLGKVLWTDLSNEVAKKIWEFQDIKDLVVKEHGAKPVFNDVTTASEKIISTISDILPRPFKHTGYFEIHCQARNQPALEYKPVVMIMNQGIVELKKVITRQQKVTEIDWVSLDRKFDFQLSLSAEERCREDVKPYSTFIKKVSVCPISNKITFENVRDFLKVDHILHKQKTFYRIHFPFIVEITRVERVPIRPQPNSGYGANKFLGLTGKGQVWFDLQVYYTNHDEPFRTNLSLSTGELASWTVEDILGPENDPQKLIEYIKCLLVLTEKCEPLFL